MAMQFGYLADKGAFVNREGKWEVDPAKIKSGVRDLAHELLTIEATVDTRSQTKRGHAGSSAPGNEGNDRQRQCGPCRYSAHFRDG